MPRVGKAMDRKRMRRIVSAGLHAGVRLLDECPMYPAADDEPAGSLRRHWCMKTEMRCVYCGARIDPWPCNGCGKFLSAEEMSGEGLCADGTRCDECA